MRLRACGRASELVGSGEAAGFFSGHSASQRLGSRPSSPKTVRMLVVGPQESVLPPIPAGSWRIKRGAKNALGPARGGTRTKQSAFQQPRASATVFAAELGGSHDLDEECGLVRDHLPQTGTPSSARACAGLPAGKRSAYWSSGGLSASGNNRSVSASRTSRPRSAFTLATSIFRDSSALPCLSSFAPSLACSSRLAAS